MVMNPLCPLKYYGLMVCHDQYNTLLWEESFRWLHNAAGPLDVPLKICSIIDSVPYSPIEKGQNGPEEEDEYVQNVFAVHCSLECVP